MARIRLLSAAVLVAMAGCLDSTTSPVNADTAPMSASIEGTTWVASAVQVTIDAEAGTLNVAGGGDGSNTVMSMTIAATAPGTYSLGPGGTGAAIVGLSTGQTWTSSGVGGSGSVTITTLSSAHVAGTFNFTGIALSGGAIGVVHVTNGKFDATR
jgi:hypothetical protein